VSRWLAGGATDAKARLGAAPVLRIEGAGPSVMAAAEWDGPA
jgi:hypothetical protein